MVIVLDPVFTKFAIWLRWFVPSQLYCAGTHCLALEIVWTGWSYNHTMHTDNNPIIVVFSAPTFNVNYWS